MKRGYVLHSRGEAEQCREPPLRMNAARGGGGGGVRCRVPPTHPLDCFRLVAPSGAVLGCAVVEGRAARWVLRLRAAAMLLAPGAPPPLSPGLWKGGGGGVEQGVSGGSFAAQGIWTAGGMHFDSGKVGSPPEIKNTHPNLGLGVEEGFIQLLLAELLVHIRNSRRQVLRHC